jgi:hypothetical protein
MTDSRSIKPGEVISPSRPERYTQLLQTWIATTKTVLLELDELLKAAKTAEERGRYQLHIEERRRLLSSDESALKRFTEKKSAKSE